MTGKTHLVGGVASALVVASATSYDPTTLIISGAVGGLLPDICHSGSKIGRKLPVVSRIVNIIFGHRTFTHSLLFLLIIWILSETFLTNESITYGLLTGMVSHFILDAATKSGIKLLYPASLTVRFPITTRTGGAIEHIVLALLTLVTLYYAKDIYI